MRSTKGPGEPWIRGHGRIRRQVVRQQETLGITMHNSEE